MDRFWSKVDKNGPLHPTLGTRCWIWTASKDGCGYGMFKIADGSKNGHCERAHRYSFEHSTGIAPGELEVEWITDATSIPVYARSICDWRPMANRSRTLRVFTAITNRACAVCAGPHATTGGLLRFDTVSARFTSVISSRSPKLRPQ